MMLNYSLNTENEQFVITSVGIFMNFWAKGDLRTVIKLVNNL